MDYPILFVDDEPNVLSAYKRGLRKQFTIDTAEGGQEGLDKLGNGTEFSVVVSDMQMPGMNGVEFLSQVKTRSPNSVRVMLTGNADQQTAIDAINQGDIFRFVNKPCSPEDMAVTLNKAIDQYRLITAEKELLRSTVKGSIEAMVEVLSLTNPEAFGRTTRIKKHMQSCVKALNLDDAWAYESMALLSLLGYVTLPEAIVTKASQNQPLDDEQTKLFNRHPLVGSELLAKIPRMDQIAEAIKYQEKCFDGRGIPSDDIKGEDIPLGARLLRVILDYDRYEAAGMDANVAIVKMQDNRYRYDPNILTAFKGTLETGSSKQIEIVGVAQLDTSMVLAEDVKTEQGMLLVCKGQEITPSVSERLINFWRNGAIPSKLSVYRN